MVDSHSVFDVPLAVRVAERLEPYRLTWYEEPVAPVAPERIVETREIRRRIRQPMAGGEVLHGGGLLELTRIAAVAESGGGHGRAAQPERPGVHGGEHPGVRGAEQSPPAGAPVGRRPVTR